VRAYLEREEVTPLLLDYLRHWIDAPCWDQNPHAGAEEQAALAALRRRAAGLSTSRQVRDWLCDCLEFGSDPL
jgi:hypothetical protein